MDSCSEHLYVVNLHAGYFFLILCQNFFFFYFFFFAFYFVVCGPCEKRGCLIHLCYRFSKCELMGLWHTESNVSEMTRYFV